MGIDRLAGKDPRIATFDRRDFTLIRPQHVEAFELLP
jgi:hypothetical protein